MMRDLVFYSLFTAPFVVLLLYRDKDGPHVFKVTCASALVLFYLLYDHVGLLLMYRAEGGIKQLATVNPQTVILLAAYSLIVVLTYVGSGMLMGRRFEAVRVPDLQTLRSMRINWFPLVFAFVLLTPLAIWKILDNSPLLLLLSGDPVAALQARVNAVTTNTHFLGIKPSYVNILWTVLAFVQIVALIIAMTRKKLRYWGFFLLVTAVYMGESFAGMSKGVIIGPLFIFLFAYALLFASGRVVNRVLVWSMAYVLIVVTAFTSWAAGMKVNDLWYPFERLFLGNLLPQYVVVDTFGFGNLLHGTTAPAWFSIGQHNQFLLDIFAWREIMRVPEGGAFYAAPSSFIAEAHANFHAFGVIGVSALVFVALRFIDYLIQGIRSELIYTALMINSALHFKTMSTGGASSFIVDYYYWALLLFALVAYRFSLTGKTPLTLPQTPTPDLPLPGGATT